MTPEQWNEISKIQQELIEYIHLPEAVRHISPEVSFLLGNLFQQLSIIQGEEKTPLTHSDLMKSSRNGGEW